MLIMGLLAPKLSGLISFRRPTKFGIYPPRLFSGVACLGLTYGLCRRAAYQRPGPFGTLGGSCGEYVLAPGTCSFASGAAERKNV